MIGLLKGIFNTLAPPPYDNNSQKCLDGGFQRPTSKAIMIVDRNQFIEKLNDLANSCLFTLLLNGVEEIIFSPQSLFLLFASLYVGMNKEKKMEINKLENNDKSSKVFFNYFVDIFKNIPIDQHNDYIINQACKICENCQVFNNFYVNSNYEINQCYIDLISAINTNVKSIDLLFGENVLNLIREQIIKQGIQANLHSCPYVSSFWYSATKFSLRWAKPFKDFDDKRNKFFNMNGNCTLENYLISENDTGNFYQNDLIKVFEKYCHENALIVGFVLPRKAHIKNFQLSNITKNFHKLRLIKAKILIPMFTLENTISFSELQHSDLGISNVFDAYDDIEKDQTLYIEDIVHSNKLILTKNGVFSDLPDDNNNPVINTNLDFHDIQQNKITIKFNHSFIWYIRDPNNNNLNLCGLFNGSKI